MNRREFLGTATRATLLGLAPTAGRAVEPTRSVGPHHLPRWRGFNLDAKFGYGPNVAFRESDFEWIAEWGFDFVRLPMSYRCWVEDGNWLKLREDMLKEIDQAVGFGQKYKIHVCINFHRAPGYCVGSPKEPLDLWTDQEALDACAFHWGHFAKRYQGVPSTQLSFNLVNEPAVVSDENYLRVARQLVEAIRAEDDKRLIIADGSIWARRPVPALMELGVAQSTRGYEPMGLTHYKASWVPSAGKWPEPTWPVILEGKTVCDRDILRKEQIEPWKELERKGVGVHVGEWGAYAFTPHKVVLAWMRDYLQLWKEANWGWALWNFRGAFGILDSNRADVEYKDFRGHKLDLEMLALLQAH